MPHRPPGGADVALKEFRRYSGVAADGPGEGKSRRTRFGLGLGGEQGPAPIDPGGCRTSLRAGEEIERRGTEADG